MKSRNPTTRYDLKIAKDDQVLEVGGGHNPHRRANVVVDKFTDSNYHRSGDIKVYKNQVFQEADGESLPFGNHEFDYVICCHVLEHVDDPHKFIAEQTRVAKRGYLETPSLIGEYLFPKESHKWVILEVDNKLVLYDKEEINFQLWNNFGTLFLDFLAQHSLGYKVLIENYPDLHTVRYEWKDTIDYLVNPNDDTFRGYFTKPWDMSTVQKFMPNRSDTSEIIHFLKGTFKVAQRIIANRLGRPR